MNDAVLLRSAHNTYLSFQGISIKASLSPDQTCFFQLERYSNDRVAIRTPQGYYIGLSNHDVFVSECAKESQLFSQLMYSNGKKAFCNWQTRVYLGIDNAGNVRGFSSPEEGVFFEEVPVQSAPMLAKQPVQQQYQAAPVYQHEPVQAEQPRAEPAPVYKPASAPSPAPIYVEAPAPAPVYITQAAPPPQIYVAHAPAPAPVYVQPAPTVVQSAPRSSAAAPMLGGFIVGNALGRRRRR